MKANKCMNKKKIFIIIGILWIVVLGGFIAYKEVILRTGNEVLLKTVPVDPQDLFRGDYVILRYDISTINTSDYTTSSFEHGDTIYVSLDLDKTKIASISDISAKKPEEGIFIKGKVVSVFSGRLRVEYGVESYFVPEGRGGEIENKSGRIYTKAAIDGSGNAVIKALVYDGEEISFD